MATLLIAGFEPFAPYRENPSWTVAQALRDALAQGGMDAATVCLPVEFDGARTALRRALDQERPRAVLALGLSGNTPFLDVEQVALNVGQHAAGVRAIAPPFPLGEASPNARRNSSDWSDFAARMRAEGLPIRISFHAGTFLCNAAYYHLLGWAEGDARRRTVFVHIPLLPDQAARHLEHSGTAMPSLAPELALRALTAISRTLLAN